MCRMLKYYQENYLRNWEDISAIKSSGFSSTPSVFESQHPHCVSQPFVTSVPGSLTSSSVLWRHKAQKWEAGIDTKNTIIKSKYIKANYIDICMMINGLDNQNT